jgi:hypothetical protein
MSEKGHSRHFRHPGVSGSTQVRTFGQRPVSMSTQVIHPQAHDHYRVVLKLDEGEGTSSTTLFGTSGGASRVFFTSPYIRPTNGEAYWLLTPYVTAPARPDRSIIRSRGNAAGAVWRFFT